MIRLGMASLVLSWMLFLPHRLHAETHPSSGPWFQGTVEQAFAKAKSEHKPVFLYWGAVWCPPCNEIKAQVFSKPRFAELAQQAVPVYLDGDQDQSQVWGDKFRVSGYPTLLLLTKIFQTMSALTGPTPQMRLLISRTQKYFSSSAPKADGRKKSVKNLRSIHN